jgi:hypothetical protein
MTYIGKDPNGLNQLSSSLVAIFVSGSRVADFGTGSLQVYGDVSASFIKGDGSGLFNISAEAIGDINRIKSGSAELSISPNKGLEGNTNLTLSGSAIITGSLNVGNDLTVSGRISAEVIDVTFISSSVIYSSGSNIFGDSVTDKHQFTGSLGISGSIFVDKFDEDETTNDVLVINPITQKIGYRTAEASFGSSGTNGTSGTSGTTGTSGTSGAMGSTGSGGTSGTSAEFASVAISETAPNTGTSGKLWFNSNEGTLYVEYDDGSQIIWIPTNDLVGADGTSGRDGSSGTSGLTIDTGSFATTGSNAFIGNQTISGSLLPAVSGAYDLGSITNPWKHIYINTGSIFLVNDAQIIKVLNANTIITTTDIASGSVDISPTLPSGIVSSSSQLTSSFDTRYTLSGSLTAGSNVSVSDTAPSSPTEGDLWWKSNDGNLYVYYDSYWIVATDTISAIPNGVISGSAQITTLGFVSGSYETTGRGIISGSAQLPSGLISGSTQLTTSFPSKTTGTWTLPAGASIQSFTVEAGHTYSMWVNGNIPNGIITWNATATLSNTNVPVVGSQFGWYYVDGNALVLTSIPDQIIGTNGGIITLPSSYSPNTSNVFKFGITNNSGTTQTINYGYIKLS